MRPTTTGPYRRRDWNAKAHQINSSIGQLRHEHLHTKSNTQHSLPRYDQVAPTAGGKRSGRICHVVALDDAATRFHAAAGTLASQVTRQDDEGVCASTLSSHSSHRQLGLCFVTCFFQQPSGPLTDGGLFRKLTRLAMSLGSMIFVLQSDGKRLSWGVCSLTHFNDTSPLRHTL